MYKDIRRIALDMAVDLASTMVESGTGHVTDDKILATAEKFYRFILRAEEDTATADVLEERG